jgi:hypothetical protein
MTTTPCEYVACGSLSDAYAECKRPSSADPMRDLIRHDLFSVGGHMTSHRDDASFDHDADMSSLKTWLRGHLREDVSVSLQLSIRCHLVSSSKKIG